MKKLFNVTIGGYYLCSVVLGVMMALTIGLAACDLWDYEFDQYCLAEDAVRREYPGGGFTEWETVVDQKTHSINYDAGVYYPKGDKDTETAWVKLSKRSDKLSKASYRRPLSGLWYRLNVYCENSFGGGYYYQYGELCLVTAAIMTVILAVMIMEGKAANKAWRQKMLQAFGFAAFIVLVDIAYRYARHKAYGGDNLSTAALLMPIVFLLVPALILKKTRSPKKAETEAEVTNPNERKKIVVPHGVCEARDSNGEVASVGTLVEGHVPDFD